MAEERKRRIARNEAVFRNINETLQGVLGGSLPEDELAAYRCECASTRCSELVKLTISEYEQVRSSSLRFVIRPGHEEADTERVAERHQRYAVVEKFSDVAEIVEDADSRRPAERKTE
jgi:hypothetical protein